MPMGPSSMLRSLSWLSRQSSKVFPLPEHHSFTLPSPTLKNLKCLERIEIDGPSLVKNVFCSIMEQKSFVDDLNLENCDWNSIEVYLEKSVDLLDVCNSILGKIEIIKRYSDSIQQAVKWVQPGMGPGAITRVKGLLGGKKYCEGDVSMDKCYSRLKSFVVKEKRRRRVEDDNSLIRSMVNAFDVCMRLDTALSFNNNKKGFSAGGSREQMVELGHVEGLGKKCEELVRAVGPLEESVKELYSQLVCVRVALLGLISAL